MNALTKSEMLAVFVVIERVVDAMEWDEELQAWVDGGRLTLCADHATMKDLAKAAIKLIKGQKATETTSQEVLSAVRKAVDSAEGISPSAHSSADCR